MEAVLSKALCEYAAKAYECCTRERLLRIKDEGQDEILAFIVGARVRAERRLN